MPTPGEARSRQTAYLATEHWWRSRVEKLAAEFRTVREHIKASGDKSGAVLMEACAKELDALIAERNPR